MHSHKDEWFKYNPPKYKAILHTPMYKSVYSLKQDFKRENGYAKKLDKWMTEENI